MSKSYQEIITFEPGKRSGKPCIRGMRITVYDVLLYLKSGMTTEDVLADFPELTRDDVQACLDYAADTGLWSYSRGALLLSELVAPCPDFQPVWDSEAYLWTSEASGVSPCGVFLAFSGYVRDRLISGDTAGMELVFAMAEEQMADPAQGMREAVAGCFLEHIVPELSAAKFAPLLGPLSRKYCEAWYGGSL